MATVAVLGGGISGLSCAYYLKTLGQSKIRYLFLLEKNPKFGGWIQTTRFPDGAIFEHGPRSIRVATKAGYNAISLADELGLSSRILPITTFHPNTINSYILSKGGLYPLPRSFFKIITKQPPFSRSMISHIISECLNKSPTPEDESVYDFALRRTGEDLANFAFDPLCRGISAGDARELSFKSMFPFLHESLIKHGSVIKGMMIAGKIHTSAEFMHSELVQKAKKESWKMWTLKTGLTEFIDTLACAVEQKNVCDLIFNGGCTKLTFEDGKAKVCVENEIIEVDHVFSCIPAQNLSPLVSGYPILSETLTNISAVDVAVVYLEYTCIVLKHIGFGFLAPSFEDSKVLGITFDSCCFPEQNGDGRTRLTCMMGGRWFQELFGDPDSISEDLLLETAVKETQRILKISDKPLKSKVVLQRNCIPQYVVGHQKKLDKINDEIIKNNLSLTLMGASYNGAGVPDCIFNAKLGVQKYLESL